QSGLREGAVVELATGPRPAEPSRAVAEVRVAGGLLGGQRHVLCAGTHAIGRHPEADVVLEAPTVSGRHAQLQVDADGHVTIDDLGSTNGTRVNGEFVRTTRSLAGDAIVQVGAVQLTCGPVGSDDKGDKGVVGPVGLRGVGSFNRPPRRMPPAAPGPVHLPAAPPEPRSGSRFGWATLLAPPIM